MKEKQVDTDRWKLFVEKLTKETREGSRAWREEEGSETSINERSFTTIIFFSERGWFVNIKWHPGLDESIHHRDSANITISDNSFIVRPWRVPYSGELVANAINDLITVTLASLRDNFVETQE